MVTNNSVFRWKFDSIIRICEKWENIIWQNHFQYYVLSYALYWLLKKLLILSTDLIQKSLIIIFRVVLNLCGGNIDTTILGRCLERGLAADGRLMKFTVTVSDRPGGINELCKLITSIGVSIKDILHERAWVVCDVFSVEVKVVVETRDMDHAIQLRNLLVTSYKKVNFVDFPSHSNGFLSPTKFD